MIIRVSKRRIVFIAGMGLLLMLIAGVAAGPIMSRVEQPEYQVSKADGAFELRTYPQMIAAEVDVAGPRQEAIRNGFRMIAAYIFGANAPAAKIAMTAPVEQQARGQTIAMTAPVEQQARSEGWSVRFIMPKSYSLATLPAPTDTRVRLVPVAPRKVLVIRFSGSADDGLIAAKMAELRAYAAAQGLATTGEPILAFYNPPWTLPPLRRNEIQFEVR